MGQPAEEAARELGLLFQQIIDESTDFAALKMRKSVAQKEFERRAADFKSSESMHEKYPATAETQTRSRDRAERAYKAICEEIDVKKSSLDNLALQSVARFVPRMIAASTDSGQSKSQLRLEELERKCEDLQNLFEEKKRFIENLQKSHEDKYQSLQDQYSKARDDWGKTKLALTKDVQPQLLSALERTNKAEVDIQALKQDLASARELTNQIADSLQKDVNTAKQKTTQLSEQIPPDLKPKLEKLNSLSERVDKFPNLRLDVDKIKQESGKSTKDLLRHIKNIELLGGYYGKIDRLEHTVFGTGAPYSEGLIGTVTQLAKLKEDQATTTQTLSTLEERLDGSPLESRLIKVEKLVSHATSLSDTLSRTNIPTLEHKLRGVEDREPQPPTATLPDSGTLSRISAIETQIIPALSKSISQISDRCRTIQDDMISMKTKMGALERQGNTENGANATTYGIQTQSDMTAGPQIDFETLKSEILEVVEAKQGAVDGVIEGISTQFQNAINDSRRRCEIMEKSCSEMKSNYDPIMAFPKQVEGLEKTFETKIRENLGHAVTGVLDRIRAQPDILPLALIESQMSKDLINKQNHMSQQLDHFARSINEQMEANSEGLINLDRRLSNINTKAMAVFILSQMEAMYPDVRNAQSMLVDLTASRHHDEAALDNISRSVDALKTQVDALETRAPQSKLDEKSLQSLRGEIDELSVHINKIQGAANDAKKAADIANDVIAKVQIDHSNLQVDIAKEIGKFRIDLEEMRDQQQAKAPTSFSAPSPALRSSAASPSRAISAGNPSRVTADLFGLAPRQSSLQIDRSHKKRKLNSSLPPTGAAKGVKVLNGTSKKKRRRVGLDEDDSEDSTFEPIQPSVSDDPDES
jgi:DNA repair exonuclease SbcCD ATPase subunit